jgi:hypothetical protein
MHDINPLTASLQQAITDNRGDIGLTPRNIYPTAFLPRGAAYSEELTKDDIANHAIVVIGKLGSAMP